jgi:lipoprotein-releasing system permease protein
MWPFFLARKQLFPPGKFPTFAFVSILGVALGVTALLVVQTVMFSFGEEHRLRTRENSGDIAIMADGRRPFLGTEKLQGILTSFPEVVAAAPAVEGGVLLQLGDDDFRPLQLRGIDPEQEPKVIPIARYLYDGTDAVRETAAKKVLSAFDDERIILGDRLAESLNVGIGDRVTVYSRKLKKILEGSQFSLPKELEVCGLLHTGFTPVDRNTALVTLATARELFVLPKDSADSVRLKLHNYRKSEAFSEQLNRTALRSPFFARPWMRVNAHFLESVDMEKEMLFFLMFIIILVASFSIGSTLFNHVTRRVREIGLISALGGRPSRILALFLSQGLLIGAVGYGIGVGLSLLILRFREEIVNLMGARGNLVEQYQFAKVPLHYNPADFIKAAVLTLVLMTAVSLLPSLWAARRKPSEAMRDVA